MAKYLLIKGHAGLGNRIFVLVTAILYAHLSDRILSVDWRDEFYSSNGHNIFGDLFSLKNSVEVNEIPQNASLYPSIWHAHLEESVHIFKGQDAQLNKALGQDVFKKYSADLSKINYPHDVLVVSGFIEQVELLRKHFKGKFSYFKEMTKSELFRYVFQEHLTLAPEIQKQIRHFKEKFWGNHVIGIHIRYSDKTIGLTWYKKALSTYVEKFPNSTIFLATDNRAVEEELSAQYPQLITMEKWLPQAGIRAHGNPECPDLREHAIQALLDIYLLAECDCLIYSRTTSFGLLARYLSKAPEDNIFDIQTYYDQRKRGFKDRIKTWLNKVFHKYEYLIARFRLGA